MLVRVQVGVEKVRAVAAAVGARVVEMQGVKTVVFDLASTPAALEDVGQLHVEVDCSIGLAELAAEGDEVVRACHESAGCCTLMASVAYRHSHWRPGVLG